MPHWPSETAHLQLLGHFRLTSADGRDASLRSAKAQALIGYLALSPAGVADRARLSGILWSNGADAKASLRQCLRELRLRLDEAGIAAISADARRVALNLECLAVDALEVRRRSRSATPGDVEGIAGLWAGELLADVDVGEPEFEQWLATEQVALRTDACRGLERALAAGIATGDLEGTIRAAQALLVVDPAHEEAHRTLIRAHGQRGNIPAAVRQYEACKGALRRQLDIQPSPETEALLQKLRCSGSLSPHALPRASKRSYPTDAVAHASITVEERAAISGDPTDRSITAALTAAVREALTRKRWLSVIDPGPRVPTWWRGPPAQAGPSYVLRLSLFRVELRIRLLAELKRADTGRLLWAEHYDRNLSGHLFGVVDELAGSITRWLDREIEVAEIARAAHLPVEPQSAYDHVLRAIPLIFKLTPHSFAESEKLLHAARDASPCDPMVYAWWGFWYFLYIGQGQARDIKVAREEVEFIVHRALELDPSNPMALAVAGHIASFVDHDYEQALALLDRSLSIDPSSAYAWDLSALTLCYTGRAEEGLQLLQASRSVWERHPNPYYFRTTGCIGLMLAGRYEQAVELCRRTIRENPNFHAPYRPLIASLGQLGRVGEARECLASLHRLEPDFSIGWFRAKYPPLQAEYAARYLEGFRRAGVPEN
jgi:DNA-binding SARP family transcriptional activator